MLSISSFKPHNNPTRWVLLSSCYRELRLRVVEQNPYRVQSWATLSFLSSGLREQSEQSGRVVRSPSHVPAWGRAGTESSSLTWGELSTPYRALAILALTSHSSYFKSNIECSILSCSRPYSVLIIRVNNLSIEVLFLFCFRVKGFISFFSFI